MMCHISKEYQHAPYSWSPGRLEHFNLLLDHLAPFNISVWKLIMLH